MKTVSNEETELQELRSRVVELERQLAEQAARTNALIAEAQERTYWLDRWHIDLNALMRRRGADQVRALLRVLRVPVRLVRRTLKLLPRR
jgi:uncharacterized coiled-coil protein SlyX